ncbi:MAG: hypothetical protein WCL71_01310, partial [Deltaproteobacteria bacterium]
MNVRLLQMAIIALFCLVSALPSMATDDQPDSGNKAAVIAPLATEPAVASIPNPEKKAAAIEFVWELDPYYSEMSLHFPLTDTPIPETTGSNEFEVYRKLFINS